MNINNYYFSVIGKINDYFYVYYNPIKVENISYNFDYDYKNNNNYALEIALGITIPIIAIVIAIIIYKCYKKGKKPDNEIFNDNKTEELMPIQNS